MKTILHTCIRLMFYIPLSKRMGIVAGTLFLLTVAPLSYADGADIRVTFNGIIATATVEATTTVLRVGGPEGFVDEVHAEGGYVEWLCPNGMPDGIYRYEVYVITGSEDDKDSEEQLRRENGQFELRNGVPVADVGLQDEGRLGDEALFLLDRTPMRVAVAGPTQGALHNTLIGLQAGNAVTTQDGNAFVEDSFGWRTMVAYVLNELLDLLISPVYAGNLTASSANPLVTFNDSDTPNLDWEIVGTGSGNNGLFAITDILGNGGPGGNNHSVIRINGTIGSDATRNSIDIDANGDIHFTSDDAMFIDDSANRVGIGTVIPANDLHIAGGSPTIRLDDAGYTVWEINSNASSSIFDIRDVTAGISPLVLRAGSGNVGIGLLDPTADLHVRGEGVLDTDSNAEQVLRMESLVPPEMVWANTALGNEWAFRMTLGNNFNMNYNGSRKFTFFKNGNLTIVGALNQNSDRDNKAAVAPVDNRKILDSVVDLPISSWEYKSNEGVRHLGPMAQDFHAAFGLGDTPKGISSIDTGGVALAAIKGLNEVVQANSEVIQDKDKEIQSLKAESMQLRKANEEIMTANKDLAARLEMLENLVNKLAAKEVVMNR